MARAGADGNDQAATISAAAELEGHYSEVAADAYEKARASVSNLQLVAVMKILAACGLPAFCLSVAHLQPLLLPFPFHPRCHRRSSIPHPTIGDG